MSLAERLLWRFQRPLGRLFRELNRVPIDCRVQVGGADLFCTSVDRWCAAMGWKLRLLERGEQRLVEREVREGMVAVDVGANLGLHTLALARAVGDRGRVWALEPDPDTFRALRRGIETAAAANVCAVEAAAWHRSGRLELFRSAVSSGENGLYPVGSGETSVEVAAVALDDLLSGEPPVSFVKLDAQGAEIAALRGMEALVARSPDLRVLCEVCPEALRRGGGSAEALLGWFRERGFRPGLIAADGSTRPATDPEALARAEREGNVNLYFRR